MVATALEKPSRNAVRVQIECSHCSSKISRNSRRGYTVRCPNCGTVNIGPGLRAELEKPPDRGARRRARRRAVRAEGAPAPVPASGESSTPAPAPVRRKRTPAAAASGDGQPGSEAKGGGPPPRGRPAVGVPATPGEPPRRGFFDGLMYGGGDDGE